MRTPSGESDLVSMLNHVGGVFHKSNGDSCPWDRLDDADRKNFQRGKMPAKLLTECSWLTNYPPQDVFKCCIAWKTQKSAELQLILEARGDAKAKSGEESSVSFGDLRVDEEKFVLNEAKKFKRVDRVSGLIAKAAKRNEVQFFVKLGKALQGKRAVPEVDRERVDRLRRFMVANWCEAIDYGPRFPLCFPTGGVPLCLLTDDELVDVLTKHLCNCDLTFDRVRKARQRLGLRKVDKNRR